MTPPPGKPFWIEHKQPDGKAYHSNPITQETTWQRPANVLVRPGPPFVTPTSQPFVPTSQPSSSSTPPQLPFPQTGSGAMLVATNHCGLSTRTQKERCITIIKSPCSRCGKSLKILILFCPCQLLWHQQVQLIIPVVVQQLPLLLALLLLLLVALKGMHSKTKVGSNNNSSSKKMVMPHHHCRQQLLINRCQLGCHLAMVIHLLKLRKTVRLLMVMPKLKVWRLRVCHHQQLQL